MTNHKEFQRFEQRPFEHVSFSDGGPLLEMLEFFETSHSSYQPLKFVQ